MKKKMLFMAALAGVVTLGSCVKDDVSSSVEAVRNAKAEELRGLANQANANAALANAQAALTTARTAADVALAQATAATAQANAQIAQANAQLKSDALAAELESVLADYNASAAADKAALQVSLNGLAAALRQAQLSELTDVQNVLAAYQTAYNNYSNAQAALVAAKVALETAKIAPEYAEKINAALILTEEKEIKKQTAILEGLNNTEIEGMTPEEVQAAAGAMDGDIEVATAKFDNDESGKIAAMVDAAQAWVSAYKAFKAAEAAYTDLNAEAQNEIGDDYYDVINAGTSDAVANGVNLGNLIGYSHLGGAVYGGAIKDADGNTLQAAGWNAADVTVNTYRVKEHGKYLFDNHIATHPDATKTILNNRKKTLADHQDALGKETDKKDTKTTREANKTGDDQNLTLYAAKALADDNVATKEAAVETAKTNMSGKPSAVATAVTNLKAAVTGTAAEQKAATIALAKAIDDAYGQPDYVGKLPGDADEITLAQAVAWVLGDLASDGGANGHTFAEIDTAGEIDALFELTGEVKAWRGTAPAATAKVADKIAAIKTMKGRASDATTDKAKATKSVVEVYDDAVASLGTKSPLTGAYLTQKNAGDAITNMKEQLTTDQDNINTAQDNFDSAEADVANWKALIAAADPEAYAAAITALNEAIADFDEAVAAMSEEEFASVTMLEIQQAIILGTATQDVETLKANAEAALATAQQNLANLKDNTDQKDTIAAAEEAVKQAENDLDVATAELLVAQKALEALEIDLDGEEEPAPAPAEDETPAEGEGESEGEGSEEA